MKQVKYGKRISGEHFSKSLPRLEYLHEDMTIMQLKKMIYEKVKYIYKEGTGAKDEEDINRFIILHVVDNLPMIQSGKYSRRRATCEFCEDNHG